MKKIALKIVILSIISTFTACNNNTSKDLVKDKSGLNYKFFISNSEARKVKEGDIVEMKFKMYSETDSLIEETDIFRIRLDATGNSGNLLQDGLSMMHIGDSALFIIDAISYYTNTLKSEVPKFIKKGSKLKFYVKLQDIVDLNDIENYRKRLYHRSEKQETMLLDDYLKRANITIEPTSTGLYFIELRKGKKAKPRPGQTVTVNYSGYFIDGQVFSSSYKTGRPFSFVFGSGDVIPGWEEGISKMQVGGNYRLIIPSYLAYGKEGKGTIIMPFTTLIFDIELLAIQ